MEYGVWPLGGWKEAPGMHALFRSNFFYFHAVFGKKWSKMASWEILDLPSSKAFFFSKVTNVNINAMNQNQVFLALCPSKVMFLKPTEFTTLYRRHVDE